MMIRRLLHLLLIVAVATGTLVPAGLTRCQVQESCCGCGPALEKSGCCCGPEAPSQAPPAPAPDRRRRLAGGRSPALPRPSRLPDLAALLARDTCVRAPRPGRRVSLSSEEEPCVPTPPVRASRPVSSWPCCPVRRPAGRP